MIVFKYKFKRILVRDFISGGVPSWVHNREMAIRDASHQSSQKHLEDRISQLETENLELKNKVESLEKGFLLALDLREKFKFAF